MDRSTRRTRWPDPRTHVVALSGGKDSTAMALALAEFEARNYTYVCTPTGDDLPEMKAHWQKLERLLGTKILTVTDRTLKSEIQKQGMLPNRTVRFCTRRIKIEPFIEFIEGCKPAVSYVGLRADELGREGSSFGGDVNVLTDGQEIPSVEHRFPLQEWGWGIDEVYNYLNKKGVQVPYRTDCARCFFQRIGEWYYLWRDYPDYFQEAEQEELSIGNTYRDPLLRKVCADCGSSDLNKGPRTVDTICNSCGYQGKPGQYPQYGNRFGIGHYALEKGGVWPVWLCDLRRVFEAGHWPERSLKSLRKESYRKDMCRACSL